MLIDTHTHIYPADFQQRRDALCRDDSTFRDLFSNPKANLATAQSLIDALDKAGVDAAVIMGVGWTDQAIAREANDYLLQSALDFPGRLIPFCSVNPAWGPDAVAELQRCARLGAKGVGELHPDTQAFDITSQRVMAPIMEAAASLRLPVLTHSSEPVGHLYSGKGTVTPGKLLAFIQNFPQNTIICAHWGGGLPFYALMPEVKQALDNVYFDSAASPYLYHSSVFKHVIKAAGLDKTLFATDFPLLGYKRLLQQVDAAKLIPQEKEHLLSSNARRLLNLK
jgi:predicted TIM-barrel fold metal-dependent hydrolase